MKALFLIPEIDKKKLGKKLAKLRKDYELTQNNLYNIAKETISDVLVSRYESGKHLPTLDRFLALCVFFSVSPEYLLADCTLISIMEFDDEEIEECSFLSTNFVYCKDELGILYGPKNLEKLWLQITAQPSDSENQNYTLHETPHLEEFVEKAQGQLANYYKTHSYNPFYNSSENIKKCASPLKITVNNRKTTKKINMLLSSAKLPDYVINKLFSYKQEMSLRYIHSGEQNWNVENLYKLSWILGIKIEHILGYAVDWVEGAKTQEFDPVYFLEHYSR